VRAKGRAIWITDLVDGARRALRRLAHPGRSRAPEPLRWHRIDGHREYLDFVARLGPDSWALETRLMKAHPDTAFTVPGFCWVDQRPVPFGMDYRYAQDLGDHRVPNWRERMECPVCNMNNRQRCAIHLAEAVLALKRDTRIYITERVTPTYRILHERYPLLVGSEFLGDGLAGGFVNEQGVRHEDLTRLSLPDASVDAILTFDVLEHIPDAEEAFAECARVLAPKGAMLFSIPFHEDAPHSWRRARIDANGTLVHDLPAAYHGDPVNPDGGILVFHDYGWDVLDMARRNGFAGAAALACRSPEYGYLGGWPLLFIAWKDKAPPESLPLAGP
jgi:SAM-dependent methyltransferase